MHQLAEQLNRTLAETVVARSFSRVGTRLYFPKGIVAQSAEAKARAHRFNATVGMAYDGNEVMSLPAMRELLAPLTPSAALAYAPTGGLPGLRAAWRSAMVEKNPSLVGLTMTEPVVVPGLTAGLSIASELLVDPGDTVVLPDLFWGNYRLMLVERYGATLSEFALLTAEGTFNRDAFAATVHAAAERGKVLVVLNFPNNPAGYTPSAADVTYIREVLVEAADRVPVVAIADDAYFGLVYDDSAARESVFAALASAAPNLLAVKVDGATKEEFAWGLRVGFLTWAFAGMTADHAAAVEKKLFGAVRGSVSNSSRLSQELILRTLQAPDYAAQKRAAFTNLRARYDRMREILRDQVARGIAPQLRALPCNSGYFMSFATGTIDAEALRLSLLDDGIGTIAIGTRYLRVAFAGVDGERMAELYAAIFAHAQRLGEV